MKGDLPMTRSVPLTLAWLIVLWLLAAALTTAGFFSFIIPDYRSLTFFSVLSYVCFSELILFGYVAYLLTVPHTVKRPSQAVRLRIMVLIVIWFFIILITGCIAVRPSLADTFFSDKIILFHLLFTFLLLLSAYFFHRSDVTIQMQQEVPQRQRVQFQSYSGEVQASIDCVHAVSASNPDRALELDNLAKRLDTLKTQLLSFSSAAEREQARVVQPQPLKDVEDRLHSLHDSVKKLESTTAENLAEQIKKIRSITDSLISNLRNREDVLSF
jgi:hypothetical protein